jgi:hypothetical protein
VPQYFHHADDFSFTLFDIANLGVSILSLELALEHFSTLLSLASRVFICLASFVRVALQLLHMHCTDVFTANFNHFLK